MAQQRTYTTQGGCCWALPSHTHHETLHTAGENACSCREVCVVRAQKVGGKCIAKHEKCNCGEGCGTNNKHAPWLCCTLRNTGHMQRSECDANQWA